LPIKLNLGIFHKLGKRRISDDYIDIIDIKPIAGPYSRCGACTGVRARGFAVAVAAGHLVSAAERGAASHHPAMAGIC
jgi:hypothetical protein